MNGRSLPSVLCSTVLEKRGEQRVVLGRTFQAKEVHVKSLHRGSEDWNSTAMPEHKTEEKHLLGFEAVPVFLHISRTIWIQECGVTFLIVRSNLDLNFHLAPLRSLKTLRHDMQMWYFQLSINSTVTAIKKWGSHQNLIIKQVLLRTYGQRWVIFFVSPPHH